MNDTHRMLLELQEMDRESDRIRTRLEGVQPQLDALAGPAEALGREVDALRTRLAEMRETERRLERGADDKRERLRKYQDRMSQVRNAREEAALRTEIDLVGRAADTDEKEALALLEQITRTDLKLDDLEKQFGKAKAEIEPRRQELEAERSRIGDELAVLKDRRDTFAGRLEPRVRQLYERLMTGRRRTAVTALTGEGACGSCFSVLPLQQQSEVRRADTIFRCEACGVVLYADD
jgi:uncharacterized protein